MNGVPHDMGAAPRRALRILLSAYACEPHQGSEPGVGWHWAIALARAGHKVWAITRANNRIAIERALSVQPVPNLRFVYHDLPRWARWWKRGGRGVRFYYVLWQWGAYRIARRLCREIRFDVVHHITFGVFRHPSFMAFLDVPFVFGPVGGGESAPRELTRTFPLRGRASELIRDMANLAARFDPVMTGVYRRSAAILCKTRETLHRVPARYRGKCFVQAEIGIGVHRPPADRGRSEDAGLRILYVGRLVYWKGLHLALAAFARLRDAHPRAQLTVIGSGPDARWFQAQALRLGIRSAVTWISRLDRAAVMDAYPRHDLFLFPSLHESSGNVVLEALACGLPVVCLDIGGPAMLVDASSGFRIPAGTPQQVVEGLTQSLMALAGDSKLRRDMGAAAMRRAREHYSWPHLAARMESLYMNLRARPNAVQEAVTRTIEGGVP